eukprot:TRINITY_DN3479_c0_g1_i1.p1 TRINITY_DN3479_c0_g1~~TRINITY_DN3479_c0_g1_i1.p1  ORF type:complete len:194 (-),score=52.40 TRINITY_DN3479_c0_g1_i1:125-706(-)
MSVRGVFQLKKIKLQFCDWSGSSKGVRKFINSPELKSFLEKNPQIEMQLVMRRGKHPYFWAQYINGFSKDISLRNIAPETIIDELERVRNSSGRQAWDHAGKKVYGLTKSIQGGWRVNMWSNYPKFEMEKWRELPVFKPDTRTQEVKTLTRLPRRQRKPDVYQRVMSEPIEDALEGVRGYPEEKGDFNVMDVV